MRERRNSRGHDPRIRRGGSGADLVSTRLSSFAGRRADNITAFTCVRTGWGPLYGRSAGPLIPSNPFDHEDHPFCVPAGLPNELGGKGLPSQGLVVELSLLLK